MEPPGWTSNNKIMESSSNHPIEKRPPSRWRTPKKGQQKQKPEEVIEFRSFENENESIRLTPATAIATPVTVESDAFSPSPTSDLRNIPKPTFRLYEDDDGHSMQWSVEPGTFSSSNHISRPTTPLANAVPVSPGRVSTESRSSFPPSPIRHPDPSPPDFNLFSEDDSVIMWSDDPERAYFEYMLQMEQEHRARQGKPAEDSLLGDSTIEEMIEAGPLAVLEVDGIQSQANRSSTLGGFSLATTEKSAPISNQARSLSARSTNHPSTISSKSAWQKRTTTHIQQSQERNVPLHKQGSEHFGRVLPDVIYVWDKTSNSKTICTQKLSCDIRRNEPKRILMLAIAFTLCGIMLAGAAVAIYFSRVFMDDSSSDGSSSNQVVFQDSSKIPVVIEYPSFTPTKAPSYLPVSMQEETNTANPTVDEDGYYWGTEAPTWESTTVPITFPNREDPEDFPSDQPSLEPSRRTDVPTHSPSASPSISTSEPTSEPTMVPSISTSEPTSEPTLLPFTNPPQCGCKYCTTYVLSAIADDYSCSDRIYFLRVNWGLSEKTACQTVAGYEYPEECSAPLCDPNQCELVEENDADNAPPKPKATPSPVSLQPSTFSSPVTELPTIQQTLQPSERPSKMPTPSPTISLELGGYVTSEVPSLRPSLRPSAPPTRRPTLAPRISPVPTNTPTQRPTSLRLTGAGNNGEPDDAFPLNRCEGDCDTDADCGPGLICYQRDPGGERVPGCFGGDEEESASDFCVPEWATLTPTYSPTDAPTTTQSNSPTWYPTIAPTWYPTGSPTLYPSSAPSWTPTGGERPERERNVLQEFSCQVLSLFC